VHPTAGAGEERAMHTLTLLIALAPTPHAAAGDARLFAPGVLSRPDTEDLGATFSDGGDRVWFVRWSGPIWETRQRLFTARRGADGWSDPRPVAATAGHRVDWPWVDPDGHLWLSWAAPYEGRPPTRYDFDDFDLWRAPLAGGGALGAPRRVPDVNRVKTDAERTIGYLHNETGAELARDGTLYFWSEREGAPGRRDIFRAEPDGAGGFEAPVALPEPINSPRMEDTFLIDPDERWILFGSDRHAGLRETSFYLSRRTDSGWSTPRRLPAPLDSEWIEAGPTAVDGGRTLVFSSTRPTEAGDAPDWNLWSVEVAAVDAELAELLFRAFGAGSSRRER
jgi:hypothetical protein